MSSSLNRIRKNIIEAMQSANKQGTSAYDSVAEVRRVEGDTAWVHIAGGVDETPVKLTIAAKAGDMVQVRVGGGRAWITGNASAPPTDDKTAIVAKSLANIAGNRAKTAQKTADQAQIVADSALEGTKENATQMAQMVIDFNGDIENLQDQIDGNISTWFYDVDPAMDLPPVTDWDTDEKKNAHLGDIYYNTVKGYAWRFMKSGSTYSWERITDTDVTKALADAAKAQDTADSKRRVFYNTPTVPYDAGDLWVQGSGGDILRCAQAKTSTGSYDRNDWVLASKYTDDTKAEQAIGDAANAQTIAKESAKTATNYLHYDSTDGLVLGNKESGSWVGYRTQIDNDSFNVLDENGNIIASYGSNEVELGKGNPTAIIKMCDGKAYVKNYIVGSQNTSVFCGQDVTVVGEWEGASEAYALFKQGFINIGQASSHIKFFNEHDNMNQVEIQGRNITMLNASTIGNFDCYMKPRFFTMAGEIKMWAGNTIPDGWLLCDGSEVSKTDYPKLYKAIGDLWGTSNSSSNFKLPNLAGKVPVGYDSTDTDFNPVGHTDGEKKHKLTVDEMPAHTHSRNYYSPDWCANGGKSGYHGSDTGSKRVTGSAGKDLAHNNLQPYAVVKYIICAI